jgi:hypothetical protein
MRNQISHKMPSSKLFPNLSFIKRNLNAPDDIDTDNLKNEYLKLKDENERLRRKIDELTKEVFIKNLSLA